ncbi:MAG: AI-2E family transporter [Planctomycetes bacterium]|nr:AI-2E family transporter [Planctomycetota bacterium]
MELDLQRFYNINRRVLMWIAFFAILYLLRHFFAVMFLTFIFGFVMRKVARFLAQRTGAPHWLAVVGPYLVMLALLIGLLTMAVPRVVDEGVRFSQKVPNLLHTLATEVEKAAGEYGLESTLARLVNPETAASAPATAAADVELTTRPVEPAVNIASMTARIQRWLLDLFPPAMIVDFMQAVLSGTLQFLLAFLLSFLIVLDFDRIAHELRVWRESPVGRFFHEAASSVVEFSEVVGTAFQCQMVIALLNASITSIGLTILDIQPVALLTTIVLLFGLIPVLGVFVSSVPIILIAFNDFGLSHALLALGVIVIVHLLEAYVFNPRIYAARFHLNPVIVLIILLVAHELFGVWGMLLGIPVTHYVLNVAQMPSYPRKRRRSRRQQGLPGDGAAGPAPDGSRP